jgi:hypothetical protein
MYFDRPLILMALANDAERSLRLRDEEKAVRRELAPVHDAERIEFRSLGNTTLDDVYEEVSRSVRKLAIFHYSGHSDGDGLHLEDTRGHKQSLATLLGSLPNLKLVFLNGCANYAQVDVLQQSGVRAIIATSVPIEDPKAVSFAQQFYQSLAGGQTIRAAFATAVSYLQNDPARSITAHTATFARRGAEWEGADPAAFPWALYFREEADVDWHLPLPEQLDETVVQTPLSATGAAPGLDETVVNPSVAAAPSAQAVQALELTCHDRRVRGLAGALRFVEGTLLLGRHPACQLVIESRTVSRRHARIYREGDYFYVKDEDSTNGTYWNDQRISLMPLTESGTLRLDDIEFRVRILT